MEAPLLRISPKDPDDLHKGGDAHVGIMLKQIGYPLVNCPIAMENNNF